MKIKNALITLILLSNLCCAPSFEEILEGNWAMDTFKLDGKDVFNDLTTVNMLAFEKNGILRIPKLVESKKISGKEREGTWEYDESISQMIINSKSDYLNGTFNICFKKENNYIKLVLENEHIYIEAGKILSELPQITKLPIKCGDIKSKDML